MIIKSFELEKLKSLDVHMDLDKGEATYTDEDGNEHTVKCPEMSKEEQKELKDQMKISASLNH